MDPFDAPPPGAPVSSPFSAIPAPPAPDEPRHRGHMALVALLTAGLVGGGIAGVSALASADKPEVALPAATPGTTEPTDSDDVIADSDEPGDDGADDGTLDGADEPKIDGEFQFDLGDGEPIVIDLGDLDEGAMARLNECIGFPSFGEFGEFEPPAVPFGTDEFGAHLDELFGDVGRLADGDSVTIAGPDGVSVVDLGENGSVTVTKDDGEVSISTSGDATVSDLSEVFGDLGELFHPDGTAGDDLERQLDEWTKDLPQLGELQDFEPVDPAEMQSCIDEVLGN